MTDLAPIASPTHIAPTEGAAPAASTGSITILPEPTASAFVSGDPLSELMIALQKQSDASLSLSTTRIRDTQASLHGQLETYLEKLKEICERLQAAQEDDGGGWFSDCFDFIGDLAGELFGTLADLQVDLVTLPADFVVDVVKNFGDSAAMLQAMQSTGMKLTENGSTADDVHGFTQGVVAFTTDFAELTARLQVDLARGALTGEGLDQATRADLQKLWGSLKQNVLDNPHFWAVTNEVAKGVAVAGAVMSGGALAPFAIGLMVLLEVDQRTGVIETLAGKEAAPWARLGVGVAASICMIGSGATNSRALAWLQAGTGVLQGGGAIYSGVRAIESANARADELEQQAELTTSLNRMQRLQRLLDDLLSSLSEDAKSNEQTRALGASLVQTKVASEAALILPA